MLKNQPNNNKINFRAIMIVFYYSWKYLPLSLNADPSGCGMGFLLKKKTKQTIKLWVQPLVCEDVWAAEAVAWIEFNSMALGRGCCPINRKKSSCAGYGQNRGRVPCSMMWLSQPVGISSHHTITTPGALNVGEKVLQLFKCRDCSCFASKGSADVFDKGTVLTLQSLWLNVDGRRLPNLHLFSPSRYSPPAAVI